jgi:hypothetical protein
MNDANTENGRFYWKGAMDTYHAMLNEAFDGWATKTTVGYYVFYEQMAYDAALAKKYPSLQDQPVEEGELFDI